MQGAIPVKRKKNAFVQARRNRKHYMVDITLPEVLPEEFIAAIPKQRAAVDRLMDEKVIVTYALAMDRSKLWTILQADSESAVFDTLSKFPLIAWMRFDIHELAFNENVFQKMTYLSWN
jgi:muconolactone delta-isomerase